MNYQKSEKLVSPDHVGQNLTLTGQIYLSMSSHNAKVKTSSVTVVYHLDNPALSFVLVRIITRLVEPFQKMIVVGFRVHEGNHFGDGGAHR